MQIIYCAIKAPQWYAVQGSDTTMMTIAASLFGQKTTYYTYFIYFKIYDDKTY